MSDKTYDQRLAGVLMRPFVGTPLHPNHVTVLSFALGVAAAYLFATGYPGSVNLAALLYMLAVLVDHMDGELARMSGKTSRFGHYFDFVVGAANYTMLFVAIGLGMYLAGVGLWALLLGLAAGLANPLIVTLRMTMEKRFGQAAIAHPTGGGFEIEDFIYLIGPITWVGGLKVFFVVYGLGTLGYLGWTIVCFWRWRLGAARGA